MKVSRRTLIKGWLFTLFPLIPYLLEKDFSHTNKPVPGSLVGTSSRIGHKLRTGNFPNPSKTLKQTAVIIGGGISGLAAGYRLNKAGFSDFVLLELEQQPGGNASSGKNEITPYPWGAHYVPLLTEESTAVRTLFEELNVITGYDDDKLPLYNEYYLCQDPDERLFRFGRWQDGLIPTIGINDDDKAQYRRFFDLMSRLKSQKGKDGLRAFAIPVDRSSQDEKWLALDRLSMAQWLDDQGFTGAPLRWYINYCCRDDFGCTMTETSAWAGIHYFAARNGQAANTANDNVITWPEGNGWLANQLASPIKDRIISQALCYSVEDKGDALSIHYLDNKSQQAVIIEASTVIAATPRFITARLVKSKRLQTDAKDFSYSPWAVANITLNKLPAGKGQPLSWDNVVFNSELLGYVNATHQMTQMQPTATVLTYYWPLSHAQPESARAEALTRSYAEWQSIFLTELLRIHPELDGLVERVDIWLWGHGMIRPTPGFIWGKNRRDALTQRPPVFTAHSDMSGISLFEEAYTHGVRAAENMLAYLNIPFKSEL